MLIDVDIFQAIRAREADLKAGKSLRNSDMANPSGTPKNLRPFAPGQSGNPGGKPVKSRNALSAKFLHALSVEFDRVGKKAIRACAEKDPSRFVTILASLLPKELESTHPLDEFTDEQLDAVIITIRAILADQSDGGDGANAIELQPAEELPAVSKAG